MKTDSSEIALLRNTVADLLKSNRIYDAEALLKNACEGEQVDADLWQMYAKIQYAKGDYKLLEKCCREVVKLRPDDISGLSNLAFALVANNNTLGAEYYFKRVLELNPGHSIAHDNLGQLYEKQGLTDKAKACYEKAVHGDSVQSVHYRHLGVTYLKTKNPEKAEQCFIQGMRLDNSDAKAYVELGRAQSELGKLSEAVDSFNQALKIKPNLNYARFWLSAINDQRATDAAKHRFVSRLFDGHAETFDKTLVNDLGYKIPWLAAEELKKLVDNDQALDILDIGCGTGLCADSFESITKSIVGVDLSRNMLDKAQKRGVYKRLIQGDVVDVMNRMNEDYDLVVAADVFVYIGGLSEVFQAVKTVLREPGFFAFSIELSDHDEEYMLRATGRYAHSRNYIDILATEYGFAVLVQKNVLLRMDSGSEIRGMMYILGTR